MNEILQQAEDALSEAWDGAVRLSHPCLLGYRKHISRLEVLEAPTGTPKMVILKHGHREGDVEGFDPNDARIASPADCLFNDWASLALLTRIFGDESPAPRLYAGNNEIGFIIIEDLPGDDPLRQALGGNDPVQAEQFLLRYAEELARIHARTLGRSESFISLRRGLGNYALQGLDWYAGYLQESLEVLEPLNIELTAGVFVKVQQVAEALAQPGVFSGFTHGDPTFSNLVEFNGRLRLFDFEYARFRHVLIEGAYPRMVFPTSGLLFVKSLPEVVWRKAESAYRAVLAMDCPAALDEKTYGPAMTAACAFWALPLCQKWLEQAIRGDDPRISVLRQCVLAWFDLFVLTTREFQSFPALGDTMASLSAELRSRWPTGHDGLPRYPVFQELDRK
jgi:hypothetical protein